MPELRAAARRGLTVHADPRIDAAVAAGLAQCVARLVAALPVRAVILGGGFGRGEGSVLDDADGIRPLNDYDLFLVVPDGFAADLRPLGRDLARAAGIRLVDLIPLAETALATLPPTQLHYDLKYGGRVLWGEDALVRLPAYPPGRVTPESPRLLLRNRLVCALEAYTDAYAAAPPAGEPARFLLTQTGKVVSACVEALLMRDGRYHHLAAQRQQRLAQDYPQRTALVRLNALATAYKLRPDAAAAGDPVAYWRDAVAAYLGVMAELLLPDGGDLAAQAAAVTANRVEEAELLLLLAQAAPPAARGALLDRVRAALGGVVREPLPAAADWEALRARTVQAWHEVCH